MIKGTQKQRVVTQPRMSVNKLAEYQFADASRRKRILASAKYPEAFITTLYDKARKLACSFACGNVSADAIREKVKEFEATAHELGKMRGMEHDARDHSNSALALENLLEIELQFPGCEIEVYTGKKKHILINGVAISIHPDLIIRKAGNTFTSVGALKFHIIKQSLKAESQQIVALMLNEYVQRYVIQPGKNERLNKKLCLSVDVFAQSSECCPESTRKRMSHIEVSCEEISARWASI